VRRIQLAAVFVILCTFLVGTVQAAERTGTFILFFGGDEAGREEYSWSADELKTEGEISVQGISLKITTSLKGSGGKWTSYEFQQVPGASFTTSFRDGELQAELGPVKFAFPLEEPFVVMDNNVFAHFEQLLGMLPADIDEVELTAVTPILMTGNQNPVYSVTLKRQGSADYEVDGRRLALDEYVLTSMNNLQMRLLAEGDLLVKLEIPMQAVEIVREGYLGLQLAAGDTAVQHYVTEDFLVQNGEITLAGTVFLPLGGGPFPAILLNSGSGPQDRQGNSPPALMTNMFTILAERLTEAGIAVLAYDERGVGESTGDYNSADLEDLLSDVEVLLDYLEAHPQIDEKRLAMLGHSEGAYFAPLFAQRLSAVVLLAGSSIPLDQIMVEQVDYQLSKPFLSAQEKAALEEYKPLIDQLLQEAREGREVGSVLPYNLEWIRQHMALRPLENVAQVKCPVLIVHGQDDLQVMPYHGEALAQALQQAGNDQVTLRYLPETTHVFTFFPTSEEFDALDPFKLNPELLDTVVSWLAENLK
jgi:fermentation-respiration switch protein FrsA (DUF1100 family)